MCFEKAGHTGLHILGGYRWNDFGQWGYWNEGDDKACMGPLGPISRPTEPKDPRQEPIPMLLTCPLCGARHIDEGEFATRPHHTHACQECGMVWRPAIVPTVGVWFLPGFKNTQSAGLTESELRELSRKDP